MSRNDILERMIMRVGIYTNVNGVNATALADDAALYFGLLLPDTSCPSWVLNMARKVGAEYQAQYQEVR